MDGRQSRQSAQTRVPSTNSREGHSLAGNLSPQAPLPAVTQASMERAECSQGGGQDTAGRRGWPRRSRDRQRTGGSCRFSSWEKPLTAFGERAEEITGSGCRQARPCPCGILSYRSGRGRGMGGAKAVTKTPARAPLLTRGCTGMVLGPLPSGTGRMLAGGPALPRLSRPEFMAPPNSSYCHTSEEQGGRPAEQMHGLLHLTRPGLGFS